MNTVFLQSGLQANHRVGADGIKVIAVAKAIRIFRSLSVVEVDISTTLSDQSDLAVAILVKSNNFLRRLNATHNSESKIINPKIEAFFLESSIAPSDINQRKTII